VVLRSVIVSSGSTIDEPISADFAVVRPIGVDDFAAVRHVERSSLAAVLAGNVEPGELEFLRRSLDTPEHTDELAECTLLGAWVDRTLVGIAGWRRSSSRRRVARIEHVHVDPLFAGLGLGRRLVRCVESLARAAGCQQARVRALHETTPFFVRLGYQIVGYGATDAADRAGLPLTHMRADLRILSADTVRSSVASEAVAMAAQNAPTPH
jgi:GNAT superfamily N-acetyltransferase